MTFQEKNSKSQESAKSAKITSSEVKYKLYYGIADCHGIESFVCEQTFAINLMKALLKGVSVVGTPEKSLNANVNMMSWRARANYQRHAVVYTAKVSDEHSKKINSLLEIGKTVEALKYLKKNALEIGISKEAGQKNMWKKIPNPDLDPFHGGD